MKRGVQMSKLRMGLAALLALAMGVCVQAVPNMLINLTGEDFSSATDGDLVPAWVNHGTLAGSFVPVGTGEGTVYRSISGVNAVSFTTRNADSVMTNGVSPNVICGASPWTFEVWVHKDQIFSGSEDVFTWTGRENWPGGGSGDAKVMEFRYGSDASNAVEHYGSNHNLPWGGAVPPVGQWHHVAVIRAPGGLERLYLNGVLRVEVYRNLNLRDDVGFFTLAATPRKDNGNWDMLFGGSIARLRIYDGALSAATVIANYRAECTEFGITPSPAPSNEFYWSGTAGAWSPWGTAGNWLYGSVPVDNSSVYIDNGGKASGFSGLQVLRSLFALNGGFEMTGGLLSVQDPANNVKIGVGAGATFDFQMTGGTLEIPRVSGSARSLYVGSDGGSGEAYIGGGSGTALVCVDQDVVAGFGNGSRGYIEVLQGGLVTVSNGNFLVVHGGGNPNNTTGEVVVAGGTIRHMRDGSIYLGNYNGANAKLVVNNGSVETAGDIRMSDNANASNHAELHLNGGLTWVRRFYPINTAGSNFIYFNGGELRNRDTRNGANADQIFMQNLTAAYVQQNGAWFDVVDNTAILVNQPLLAGPDGLGGGLKKTSAGILTLGGANTFTGDITVTGGTLLLRNGAGLVSGYSGNILLQNGACIGYEAAGGANRLLARIDKNSVGTLYLFSLDATANIDLSQHPGLSLGMYGSFDYTGNYTPPVAGQYRFTAANGGNAIRYNITGSASVIIDAASPPTGSLDVHGDNTYTGGTTIYGGRFVMYHVNAIGQTGDIGIYGGALMFNADFSQAEIDAIIARIKLDSCGAILIGSPVVNREFNLSGLPGLALGADTGRDLNGAFLPYEGIGYRAGGGGNDWSNSGLGFKNLPDGVTPRKFVADTVGSVQLVTNNLFTGGIVVSNNVTLWMQNDTALGAVPTAGPVADYLIIDNGRLRPNPGNVDIPVIASHPDRGLTVGDGGMTVHMPYNRYWAWQGDLHGTGAITNSDSGVIIFGGANNTWTGTLSLNRNNDEGAFAVGWGNNFSWVKTNVIQGNSMFGVATDLDITWSDKFENPLGTVPASVPPSFDVPEGHSASLGLRKLGAGTLTLDRANSYRRMTHVESGTLKVGVADAIPWGGGKGNLHVVNNNLFPAGVVDINGYNVNINAINGSGIVTNSQATGSLILGNNNHDGTFYGTIDSSVNVTKTGTGKETFLKGADVRSIAVNQGTIIMGAEASLADVSLAISTVLSVGDTYGLMGEYYWFDMPGLFGMMTIASATLPDYVAFNSLLDSYAPTHIQSSTSFGAGFDAGSDGSRFNQVVNFSNRGNFYGRWTGQFYAAVDGEYTFSTASDDGSVVYVKQELVVNNSRDQGYSLTDKRYGAIELEQGWHNIVVGYYQGGGNRGLTVFMAPPGGDEVVLPQTLLRPHPANVGALTGVTGSRMEIPGNAGLAVESNTSPFAGRLVAASADALFVKQGLADFTLSGQVTPEFAGEAVVAEGTLGLQGATPFSRPVHIEENATLAAFPLPDNLPNRGLKGTYYSGNFTDGNASANGTALNNYFNSRVPTYIAYTTQTGVLAVADSPAFNYSEGKFFPGPYSRDYEPAGDKRQFSSYFQGKLLVLEPGLYGIGIESDDRSDVLLNGVRIIENTLSNSGIRRTSVYLDAGLHDLQIVHGQGDGGWRLCMYLTLPGGVETLMPNALLRSAVSRIPGWKGAGNLALPSAGSFLSAVIDGDQELGTGLTGPVGAEFEKRGIGTLTLTADNIGFGGTWYVMQGTLVVGDGDLAGTLCGEHVHVATGARLVFNRSDDITYAGLITGGGEILNIGAGCVTITNLAADFTGAFIAGDFAFSGETMILRPDIFTQGQDLDPLNVHFENGAMLVLPPPSGTSLALPSLVFSNAMLSLPLFDNGAYNLDSLMIEAGTTNTIGVTAPSGLFGRYYTFSGENPDSMTNYFKSVSAFEAFAETLTPFAKVSSWDAGDVIDFGSADDQANFPLKFPQAVIARRDNFVAIWKGQISITSPGEYTFRTRSDDNSMLFINDKLVIDNNGSHGMRDASGPVTLGAGLHDIAILFGQGTGGYGLIVSLMFPNTSAFQNLPNSMLVADPADYIGSADISWINLPGADVSSIAFSVEVGTLGVVNGPGVGMLDITSNNAVQSGTLLLNDLYIETLGAVIAAKGNTQVAGSNLSVTLTDEPPPNTLMKIADFGEAPAGLPLAGKATTLNTAKGKLTYRVTNKSLYVTTVGGTVLILR